MRGSEEEEGSKADFYALTYVEQLIIHSFQATVCFLNIHVRAHR